MKPDGIHFAPGKIKGLNFPIFLDLSEPVTRPEPKLREDGILIAERLAPGQSIQFVLGKPKRRALHPGRINYKIHNYCARCKIKYGKDIYRCKNCNGKVRTKAWASNYSRKKNKK
jgi:hypothetical protein